ncbi:MAG: OmpA family protein [Verrucomicrobiota bacterium]
MKLHLCKTVFALATYAATFIGSLSSKADETDGTSIQKSAAIVKAIEVEGVAAFSEEALPFKFDSTELASERAHRQLVEIAKALQSDALRSSAFIIEGHTCDLGQDSYNLDLSKRRAGAIVDLLSKAGIPASRLEVVGKGEAAPSVANTNAASRAKTRRVESRLVP